MSGERNAASTFAQQTEVRSDNKTAGRYHVFLADDWNTYTTPQGGLSVAAVARAMGAEIGVEGQVLRSLHATFVRPVTPGTLVVDVEVVRRGSTMSQARGTLAGTDGGACLHVLATFGSARTGFRFTDRARPDVPPPDACRSFWDPSPARDNVVYAPFWERVEGRPAIGHLPWDDYRPTGSMQAHWYRFDVPPVLPDGTLDPLALLVLSDLMPNTLGERMGPGLPLWFAPSADLTVHLLQPAAAGWVLARAIAHHAGDGYASLEIDLWDSADRLVAHATQVCYLIFPNQPLPSDRVEAPPIP